MYQRFTIPELISTSSTGLAFPHARETDYNRFKHTQLYLFQKLKESGVQGDPVAGNFLSDDHQVLVGWFDGIPIQEIYRNMALWHSMSYPIPIEYLEVIGANTRVLESCVEFDSEDFYRAMDTLDYPTRVVYPLSSGLIAHNCIVNLDENGYTLDEIKSYARSLVRRGTPWYSVMWDTFKSLVFDTKGETETIHEPRMDIEVDPVTKRKRVTFTS